MSVVGVVYSDAGGVPGKLLGTTAARAAQHTERRCVFGLGRDSSACFSFCFLCFKKKGGQPA